MVTQNVRVLRSCVQQLLILHCYSLNKKKEKKMNHPKSVKCKIQKIKQER